MTAALALLRLLQGIADRSAMLGGVGVLVVGLLLGGLIEQLHLAAAAVVYPEAGALPSTNPVWQPTAPLRPCRRPSGLIRRPIRLIARLLADYLPASRLAGRQGRPDGDLRHPESAGRPGGLDQQVDLGEARPGPAFAQP